MASTETRSEKLQLRLTCSAKRLLRSAAQAQGRPLSEFVLECALRRAEEDCFVSRAFLNAAG